MLSSTGAAVLLMAGVAMAPASANAQAAPVAEAAKTSAAPAAIAPAPASVVAPPVVATPTAPVTGTAPTAATAADAVTALAGDASYVPMRPTAGVGRPVDGGLGFQPQATRTGERALFLNDGILLPIMAAITLLVLGLLLYVIARFRRAANPVPSKTSHNTLIEVLWTLIPVVILVGISIPSIGLLAEQYRPAKKDALVIKVTGYQWYWGYAYPDNEIPEFLSKMVDEKTAKAAGEPHLLAVDNRMVVPVGRQVKLLVTGGDVIHSFAVPSLWTKMDAIPGRSNETTFTVERPGVYYGQCSELCGVQHAFMPIAVEALPEAQFNAWVRTQGGKVAGAASVAGDAPMAPTGTAPSPAIGGASPKSVTATSAAAGATTAQTAAQPASAAPPRVAPQGDAATAASPVAGPAPAAR